MSNVPQSESALSQAVRLNEACNRFELAWKAGQRPRIEDYLGDTPDPERSAIVRELIALDMDYRRQAGEQPMTGEYRDRFPFVGLEQTFDKSGAPPSPQPPERLGDFEILREIARGGMGVVYEARQVSLNRRVALKVLSCGLSLTQKAVQRFRREAEAAAKLHHTNIVPVYATGEENGSYFYAMELIEGPSLDRVIRQMRMGPVRSQPTPTAPEKANSVAEELVQTGPYLESTPSSGAATGGSSSSLGSGSGYFDTVARLIAEVADALEYAHKQGVIHRDIKPSNLLLSPVGRLSVNDFGLARLVEQPGMTMTGEFVGSPLYMSPEQIAAGRAPLDHRTDIYSLGATLYELLTLEPPHGGERREQVIAQILHKEPRPPRRVNRRVPVDLETICLKAMDKDPDRRYPTAGQLAEDLRRYVNRYAISARRAGPITRLAKFGRRHQLGVAAAVAVLFLSSTVAVITWKYRAEQDRLAAEQERAEKEQWVRQNVLPAIRRLVSQKNYSEAFQLAEKAEQAIPNDPTLAELRPEFTSFWTVTTQPPGADVSVKPYEHPEAEWKSIGRSPLDGIRLPRGFFRWKVTKEGYEPVEGFRNPVEGRIQFTLDREGSLPPGMVRVSGNAYRDSLYGLDDFNALDLEDYFIDRYEVTNRQFKEFVDQGGYRERKCWKHFQDQKLAPAVFGASTVGLLRAPLGQGPLLTAAALFPGKMEKTVLSWENAMEVFRDQTGKPGPSTWQSGTYPAGEDDYPVGGVCWYEAAAFAEFAGKSLPTVAHWVRASGHLHSGTITELSNFQHSGPARVGTYQGMGPFGTLDMAGNVKEWCWNEARGNRRFILGGAWDEPPYLFANWDTAPSLDRSRTNGFRCVKLLSEKTPPAAFADIFRNARDYEKEAPVSDERFQSIKSLYAYVKTPLHARTESTEESTDSIHEMVTFDAAYDKERVIAHLYLPRRGKPPYQAVVYFPGNMGFWVKTSFPRDPPPTSDIASILRSGRAVLYPVYRGTYDRWVPDSPFDGHEMNLGAELMWWIQWYQDFARSVDYLEERSDVIDQDKLAYLGGSWGASMGLINLALDDRIKAAVLAFGGLPPGKIPLPELDYLNFAPRVRVPVLMINGRNDPFFPLETSQKPLYRLLGTPAKDKHHVHYKVPGHGLPAPIWEKDMLSWLDKYLGKVR